MMYPDPITHPRLITAAEDLLQVLAHSDTGDDLEIAIGDLEIAVNESRSELQRLTARPAVSGICETCFLPATDPEYTRPHIAEVRILIRHLGWTGSQVADYLGLESGRAVRRWLSEDCLEHIPYACWRLLCIAAGVEQ